MRAEEAGAHAQNAQQDEGESGFVNQVTADTDVSVGRSAKHPVEPAEECAQRSASFFFRTQQHGGQAPDSATSALKAENNTETAMVTANC